LRYQGSQFGIDAVKNRRCRPGNAIGVSGSNDFIVGGGFRVQASIKGGNGAGIGVQ